MINDFISIIIDCVSSKNIRLVFTKITLTKNNKIISHTNNFINYIKVNNINDKMTANLFETDDRIIPKISTYINCKTYCYCVAAFKNLKKINANKLILTNKKSLSILNKTDIKKIENLIISRLNIKDVLNLKCINFLKYLSLDLLYDQEDGKNLKILTNKKFIYYVNIDFMNIKLNTITMANKINFLELHNYTPCDDNLQVSIKNIYALCFRYVKCYSISHSNIHHIKISQGCVRNISNNILYFLDINRTNINKINNNNIQHCIIDDEIDNNTVFINSFTNNTIESLTIRSAIPNFSGNIIKKLIIYKYYPKITKEDVDINDILSKNIVQKIIVL